MICAYLERSLAARCESEQNKAPVLVRVRLLAVSALVIAATCHDPASPSATVLRTDSSSYAATATGFGQVEVRLILTYRNPADTAVALDRCLPAESYPIYSVELVLPANAEGAAYNPGWACVGGAVWATAGAAATSRTASDAYFNILISIGNSGSA